MPNAGAAAPCANEAIRESQSSETLAQGSTYLPACMALEMVSPPKKNGQEAGETGAFSTDGERVLFNSKAALAETEGLLAFQGDNYVASRGGSGWVTAPTSPPKEARISVGAARAGGPYAFAPDLGSWVLFGGTQQQKMMGEGQIFRGTLGGGFEPLSSLLSPIDDSGTEKVIFFDSTFNARATSADLSATVFRATLATTAYLPGDPRSPQKEEPGKTISPGVETNSYLAYLDESGQPNLALLSRDKDGIVYGGRCGSSLGGGPNQGAISSDGSRIYFTTRPAQPWNQSTHEGPECSTANPLRIFKRTETPLGPEISELLPGEPAAPGDDRFQGASLDGTKVFLTSPRNLTASDKDTAAEACSAEVGKSAGCDLYLYDSSKPPAERLTQISAGEAGSPTPGEGADVLSSIVSISADGSHVYFAAQGVLSTELGPAGKAAEAGKPNLYLYEQDAAHPSGHLAFIATLDPGDRFETGTVLSGLWGSESSFANSASAVPLLGGGAEGGGDGHIFVFVSKAELSPEDTDGTHSDAYRYDAQTASMQCVSCPSGGPDSEPFDIQVNSNDTSPSSNFAEQGRWVSEDGETVAFATAEPIDPEDADGIVSPYLWKEGQLGWLPGVVNSFSQRPVLSASGGEAAFTSPKPLLPQDGDTARDIYLVRADGGFPNPTTPVACNPLSEGSCQGTGSTPPAAPPTSTLSFSGPGNEKAPQCKQGQARKRGKCVRAKKKSKKKRASHKRGGKK